MIKIIQLMCAHLTTRKEVWMNKMGVNIEVKFAGSCSGWRSLELYFPPCSRPVCVRLVAREVVQVS